MPTYQYRCTECDHAFEEFQSFTDDALSVCPVCGGRLRKVFNAVGVVFKGSGFYRNDSRSKSSSSTNGASSDAASGSSTGSADSSSTSSGSSESSGVELLVRLVRLLVGGDVIQRGRVVLRELTLWRGPADPRRARLRSGDVLVLRGARVPDRAP